MATADLAPNKIQLEIVTPRGKALTASVDEVTAPSVDGEFGVMPGHLPLLAALRTGLVTYREGTETHKCAVGTGFAEAGANKLLILTDEYIVREQIDPVVVRKELAEVQTELEALIAKADEAQGGDDHKRALILKENWLAAQLELYGDPPAATMRVFEEYGPPAPPADEDVPTDDTTH